MNAERVIPMLPVVEFMWQKGFRRYALVLMRRLITSRPG
jgi:hypothetical protein